MKKLLLIIGVTLSLTSCMINHHVIGEGAKGSEVARKKTVYIIGNRVSEVDTKSLAGNAQNYEIDTRSNFVDMLISSLTFGIVNTRTVTVKK